ncbi:MAG: DUF6036 family nucleotidyltransferase [Candidatus Polarisedimenticolia bacterium]
MEAIGRVSTHEVKLYFTGGATAVLSGWRASTIDVDILLIPEDDRLLRELPALKESLKLNIEMANPSHFIPEVPGWQDRSSFIERRGHATFFHYDPYSQALAKIERGHAQDESDVQEMLRRGVVEREKLMELFGAIEPHLYRYPALDPRSFRAAVERAVTS